MALLNPMCEEIFLVFHQVVIVVGFIVYWQCQILWKKIRQAIWNLQNIAGFIFLLFLHFTSAATADLWLSTYLVLIAAERYQSVASNHWHNVHVTQRKVAAIFLLVAVSFCCCVFISEFVSTQTDIQSGKIAELAIAIIITLCCWLVLISQSVIWWKGHGLRKKHPHPRGPKIIRFKVPLTALPPPPPLFKSFHRTRRLR
jgi:hypothetical protein